MGENDLENSVESLFISEEDPTKFYDTYITMPSFNDKRIISYNEDPIIAMQEARSKGFPDPVKTYVPCPDVILLPSIF